MSSVFFKNINQEKINKILSVGDFPFSQTLFWETPLEKLDIAKHKRPIIERVITRGSIEDFYILLQLYSNDEIKESILQSRILDDKTANFCSLIFQIPKSSIHVSSYYS